MAQRTGIQLAYPYTAKRLARWDISKQIIIQPKLNGVRAWYDARRQKLISSSGREITSCPHIIEQLSTAILNFDGEIYNHGYPFQHISGLSRLDTPCTESLALQFHVFDIKIPDWRGGDLHVDNATRAIMLKNYLQYEVEPKNLPNIYIVPTTFMYAYPSLLKAECNRYLAEGYEGIILRNPAAAYISKRTGNMLKLKPRHKDAYKIIGVQEEISKDGIPKNTLGAFVLDDRAGGTFNVGTGIGLTKERRKYYWERWAEILTTETYAVLKYLELSEGGIPQQPVLVDIVDRKTAMKIEPEMEFDNG
jgi:DNA ligase 1